MNTQKLIEKLNKKDKEEYIEKRKEIFGEFYSSGLTFVNYIFYYTAFIFIAIPLWYMAFQSSNPELFSSFLNAFYAIGKILIYAMVFGFVIDYFQLLSKLIKLSKLKKEYFKIVPIRK